MFLAILRPSTFLLSVLPLYSGVFFKYQHIFPTLARYNRCDIRMASKSSKIKNILQQYVPLTVNQKLYTTSLENYHKVMTVAIGPAGTGKTLFACTHAIHSLKKGIVEKIVITRPLVSVEEEEIGFLPGNLVSKMDPWTKPIFDIFEEFYSVNDIHNLVKQGTIEIAPLAFMRGRTFHNTYIIADEMQNSSPNQITMLSTRVGKDSKLIITGDLKQGDRKDVNGLVYLLKKIAYYETNDGNVKNSPFIDVVYMSSNDVFRSPFVAHILSILNDEEAIEKKHTTPYIPTTDECAIIPKYDMDKLRKL
jgi:phosphate starvation-inducible PhoH-like protein